MRRKLLALALAVILVVGLLPAAVAAADDDERGVLTYKKVIAAQYEDTLGFSDGLAAVKKDGKWGYVDYDNKTVIPFIYDAAGDFNEGKAVVGRFSEAAVDTYGVWDDELGDYVESEATYSVYELGFIDKDNKATWITASTYDGEPKKVRVYAKEGANPAETLLFYNNTLYVDNIWYKDDVNATYIFDTDGKVMNITDGYFATGHITEGMIPLYYNFYDPASGKILDIEDPGDSFYVDNVGRFNQGLAPVWTEHEYEISDETWGIEYLMGFVNKAGQWVIAPSYTSYWRQGVYTAQQVFDDTGVAMVADRSGNYGGIDKNGNVVIPFEYDTLSATSFGVIAFEKNGKWGYMDAATHKVIIAAKYENATSFSSIGIAVVYDGKDAFLINTKGDKVEGAGGLSKDLYFREKSDGSTVIYTPSSYVVFEENGKKGFGKIEYLPPLPEVGEVDSWAHKEVTTAIENDLVPTYLQNLYKQGITRMEFCDVVMQMVTTQTGKSADELVKAKTGKTLDQYRAGVRFTDTSDSNCIAANALGIISGRSVTSFAPYDGITRQEAAGMLRFAAEYLKIEKPEIAVEFKDAGSVANWAKESVAIVSNLEDPETGYKVMTGTGADNFSPLGTYTREQAYMTINRLYNIAQDSE